jgi:hypothetical protein
MPSRIRDAAIALGLIVASLGALAQEGIEPALESQPVSSPEQEERANARQQDDPGPEQDRAADLLPGIQGIEAAIRDLIAKQDDAERQRQEDREIADLQAQNDMAFWAMLMFFATVVATFVTAAGVLLIYHTLKYTKAMAGDTQRTADAADATATEAKKSTVAAMRAAAAAIKANTLQRNMFIASNRPWLCLDPALIISDLKWNAGAAQITFQLHIHNFGDAVATDLNIRSVIELDTSAAMFRTEKQLTIEEN